MHRSLLFVGTLSHLAHFVHAAEWTEPVNACISGFNRKSYDDTPTIEECMQKCDEERSFQCLAIEYSEDGDCDLQPINSKLVAEDGFDEPCGWSGYLYAEITTGPSAAPGWTEPEHACMSSFDRKTINDVYSIEKCTTRCEEERTFECLSVDYDVDDGECNLQPWNSKLDPDDDFSRPCGWSGILYSELKRGVTSVPGWTEPENACISGNNEKSISDVFSIAECINKCEEETSFRCISVDFEYDGDCMLQKINSEQARAEDDFEKPCGWSGIMYSELQGDPVVTIGDTVTEYGSNFDQILNRAVTLKQCLDQVKESGSYTDSEMNKLGQTLRILQKLAKYKFLGEIDTSTDLNRDFTITNETIEDDSELSPCANVVYNGDMLITSDQMDQVIRAAMNYSEVTDLSIFNEDYTFSNTSTSRAKRKITTHSKELWNLPITYKISSSGLRSLVESAIAEWESETCVTFSETRKNLRRLKGNYINFKKGDGCHSNVGKKKKRAGQTISLGTGCQKKFIAAHEIGHALGLWHEQARPDRDEDVEINENNIEKKYLGNFLVVGKDDTDTSLPYDHGSVMHYASTAFAKKKSKLTIQAKEGIEQLTMGQRKQLAFYDVKAINDAYCSDVCATPLTCSYGGYTDPKDCTKCRCPQGLSGTTCDEVEGGSSKCSESQVTASSSWQALSISGQAKCHWRIKATGSKVELKFESMNFACLRSCKGYVELKLDANDYGRTGGRFCCKKPSKTYKSETDELLIIYDGGSNGELNLNEPQ